MNAETLERFKQLISENRMTTNETILEHHSKDESHHTAHLPEAVLFPESSEEVSKVLSYANETKTPVTPFGLGSGLEGHVVPASGGISLDFSEMKDIVEIREQDLLVRVQPGVTRSMLDKALKKHGLFFPVDPGADATIGGMTATNASGTTSVKYGVMKDQIRDLEVVTPDGQIIHTGNLAQKSSSGYNLNDLYTGSEGTLGCITEITLKVYGIPEHVTAARATFPGITEAVDAVTTIVQTGVPVARVELVDETSIQQVNKLMDTDYEVNPTLFLEFHGNEAGLNQDVAFTEEILNDHGCTDVIFEKDNQTRMKLWEGRHNLAYTYSHDYPGRSMMVTDVCVPISSLAEAIIFGREQLEKQGLPGGIVGHVGDGNYHALMMIDKSNEEDIRKAENFNKAIVEHALERGGTCTGEHGVGLGKKKYLEAEHGAALGIMKTIKRALDPNNIMNPGKFIDID
ncbi:FAD-binding oxidoreductase [Salimicrobium halophilum]|uniref:D-lactate dehydrogenase (cytochrome) n=1 Tax=Salimicrobium halophilum TaxID=86666 RepID=A0A1G8T1U7_9BACI|nr:FAD-linked oxidase C-terminal domain-containing protein [Salimicrobium halophilum]SDJ35453.1 D-lactate dehydrogenase (cytochrome) [Salimicrobium halophilum]